MPAAACFVTSWKNGGFSFERPDVGFVAMITPENFVAHPAADLKNLDDAALVQLLRSPSDALRLSVQQELIRRCVKSQISNLKSQIAEGLVALAKDRTASVNSRIAAVWTLRQANWKPSKPRSVLC